MRGFTSDSRGCAGNFLNSIVPPGGRIGAGSKLRILLYLALIALLGCSADAVHSVQTFFPGPDPTTWDSCDKFGSGGDEIIICAGTAVAPGGSVPTYNIRFSIPNAAHVRIVVFDSHAALVKVLFDADEPATLAGQLRSPPIVWDYTDDEGNRVPDGDYRFYFESGSFLSTSDVTIP